MKLIKLTFCGDPIGPLPLNVGAGAIKPNFTLIAFSATLATLRIFYFLKLYFKIGQFYDKNLKCQIKFKLYIRENNFFLTEHDFLLFTITLNVTMFLLILTSVEL